MYFIILTNQNWNEIDISILVQFGFVIPLDEWC